MTPNRADEKPPNDAHRKAVAGFPRQPPLPPWWRADRAQFEALLKKRGDVHRREKAAARKAESLVAATLLLAVSAYSVDATGAVSIPAAPGFLVLFAALVLPMMAAWLLDRRLTQQLSDIALRSALWLDLVDAVKNDCIDAAALQGARDRETEIELILRREVGLAMRFLSSKSTLTPHLPLFGHCFTLEERSQSN